MELENLWLLKTNGYISGYTFLRNSVYLYMQIQSISHVIHVNSKEKNSIKNFIKFVGVISDSKIV